MKILKWYSIFLVGTAIGIMFYRIVTGGSINIFQDILSIMIYLPVFYYLTKEA